MCMCVRLVSCVVVVRCVHACACACSMVWCAVVCCGGSGVVVCFAAMRVKVRADAHEGEGSTMNNDVTNRVAKPGSASTQ